MPTNAIVPFALAGGANVEDPVSWLNDPTRLTGFVAGQASSKQVNTALRQALFPAAMITQFIVDNAGINVNDDGNISALEAGFAAAILASVLTSPRLHPQVQQAYFTSAGSYNFTVPQYVTQLEIWTWGGGAGGGGCQAPGGAGSGGSGGGFAVGIFTVVPNTQFVVTVGQGGAPGAAGNNNGGNGGQTSFGDSSGNNLIYATGGTGGRGAGANQISLGGATYCPGGLGIGGSFQYQGEHGHNGFLINNYGYGGPGGGSWGIQNTFFSDGAQQAGYGPGGGGSGGSSGAGSSTPIAGGAGLPGMVWVRWTI